jgi:hypothetical protein
MEQTKKRIILTLLISCALMGCKTCGEHWLKNPETGDLEMVEYIEMRGTAKHEIEFSTKGKAKADSGLKLQLPDINLDVDKIGN